MSEYLTFPIAILSTGKKDIKAVLNDAMNYCLYVAACSQNGNQNDRIKDGAKQLGITFPTPKACHDNGFKLFLAHPAGTPKASIRKEMVFDFYKNDKTEFEILTFLAFAAMRSILQMQPCTKITNTYLLSRMAGNSKADGPLPEHINNINTRRHLDKIKQELQLNWGLKLYANHCRGFWISFSMPITELIKHVEIRRKKTKLKELQQSKEAARIKVLALINSTY